MLHLVFVHKDGSESAVAVTGSSTVHVQTWRPPRFGDEGTMPVLIEDQTLSMDGVVDLILRDDGSPVQMPASAPVPLSDEEAAALEPVAAPEPGKDDYVAPWAA